MTHKTFYDLISAIKIGRSKDVGELLKKRANPNILGRALCEGEGCISALAIAIERGDAAMVELLLKYGANLHDIDSQRWGRDAELIVRFFEYPAIAAMTETVMKVPTAIARVDATPAQ